MMLKSRLQKLTAKLTPKNEEVHCFGWADCTWSTSEGLVRLENESKEDFLRRVQQTTKKQYLWFE